MGRFMNSRFRTVGVDGEGLDLQIKEKDDRRREEMAANEDEGELRNIDMGEEMPLSLSREG